jgi:hypothetical protein
MTLEEVDSLLPNGLHDARIQCLSIDYKRRVLAVKVSVLVGTPEDPPPSRDRYRVGLLEFEGVVAFVVEPPRSDSPFRYPGALAFSWRREGHDSIGLQVAQILLSDDLAYSLFIQDWLSSMIIVARGVGFRWVDGPSAQ